MLNSNSRPLTRLLRNAAGHWRYLILSLAMLIAAGPAQAGSKLLKIVPKKDGSTIHFNVENLEATEITATFELELENLQCSQKLPYTCTLAPHLVTEAFSLTPIHAGGGYNYNYTSRYTIGSSVAVHDDSYVYTLPYAPNSAYRVTQGYNGSFSHTGPDQYALDFKMPIGTPVHAARDGVVVKVKVDSSSGGAKRKYENYANYILIRHADGTLANYAHLQKDGSAVKVGQAVQAGDLIGWSGNTGFSSGPHLHFSVFKTRNGSQRQTLPVKFQTADSFGITLTQGKTYKSILEEHHGKTAPAPALAGSHGHKASPGTGSPGEKF